MLNSAEQAQLSWAWKKVLNFRYFYFYDQVKFHAQLSWAWKKFYNLGTRRNDWKSTLGHVRHAKI